MGRGRACTSPAALCLASKNPRCIRLCKTPHYGNRHSRLLISQQEGPVMTNTLLTLKQLAELDFT